MRSLLSLTIGCLLLASAGTGLDAAEKGAKLKSVGPIAFGPNGVLLVSDPLQASVYAIETADTQPPAKRTPLNVKQLDKKVASLLGTSAEDVQIRDLAVNPISGRGYLAVLRGRGPDAIPVILVITGGEIAEFNLSDASTSRAELPNAPEDAVVGQGRRRRNPRMDSITDIAFVDGQVIVAGLSNEEFASKLRTLEYPFKAADAGTSIEVYHGAHGQLETRSPVRTFVPMTIGDQPHLLAAYTCTPLVKFPLSDLKPGKKVRGTTIAELGNRNTPLDMVAYSKNGHDYLLIANTARGVMKVDTADVGTVEGITERVSGGGVAGLKYETIKDLQGVMQLEKFDDAHAAVIIRDDSGAMTLMTVPLP